VFEFEAACLQVIDKQREQHADSPRSRQESHWSVAHFTPGLLALDQDVRFLAAHRRITFSRCTGRQ
jgi:hypothetical protein